jgi:hypothetical protein
MAATTVWLYYHRSKEFKFVYKSKPIARITKVENEILVRPSGHLIWQEINNQDLIYPGEALRTLKNSSAQVEFLNDGTKIEIEPESVVVLDQNVDKMKLDFLSGSMLVNNANKEKGGLIVSSGGKILELNESQTVFSGDAKTGVNVDEMGKDDKSLISIVKPEYLSHFLQDSKNSKEIQFSWRSQNKFNKIELWLGPERTQLSKFMDISNKDIENGFDNLQISPGRHYWQLRGDAEGKLVKSTIRSIVINKFNPPVLMAPNKGQLIERLKGQARIHFVWVNKNQGYEQKIQVSREITFQKVMFEKIVEFGSETKIDFVDSGDYFWRLQTFAKNNETVFTSEVQNFTLNITSELIRAQLLFPENEELLFSEKGKSLFVRFSWKPVPDASEYSLTLIGPNGLKSNSIVSESQWMSPQLKEGEYTWTVETRSAENLKSQSTGKFSINSIAEIGWLDPKETKLKLDMKQPVLSVSWNEITIPVAEYIFTAKSLDPQKNLIIEKRTADKNIQLPIELAGKYELNLVAMHKSNRVIGKSKPLTVELFDPDLIGAPEIVNTSKEQLIKSTVSGDLKLQWSKIKDAVSYEVVIEDEKGLVKRYKVNGNYIQFRKLHPGNYKVYVFAIDPRKRKSSKSKVQAIVVPNESDALPPELRKVKIR